jgi:hypothetical protein
MASWDIYQYGFAVIQLLSAGLAGLAFWTIKSLVSEFRTFKDETLTNRMTRDQIERKFDGLEKRLDKIAELEIRVAVVEGRLKDVPRSSS